MDPGVHNLLVISDLHLGEDLRPGSTERHFLDRVEAELSAFLTYHTIRREFGAPWRLVINGDMLDFLAICLIPPGEGGDVEDDERVYGLSTREDAALQKMAMVVARHGHFFDALAVFIGAGNAVEIVAGNHDPEFHWPAVQRAFVAVLEERLALARSAGKAAPDLTVEGQVRFHTWFYYEPGAWWIEHGHQYDVYCSFDTPLDPRDPRSPYQFEENLGSAAMRYVGNVLPGATADHQDSGFLAYLKLAFADNPNLTRGLLVGYWTMVRRLGTQWFRLVRDPGPFLARRRAHRERIRALARQAALAEEVLQRLYRLRARPVWSDLYRLTTALMLGRLLVTIAAVLLVPVVVGLLPWSVSPWALVGLLMLASALHVVLAWSRVEVDPGEVMQRAAGRIRQLVDAPLVVMGHTHQPVAARLQRGGWYFNTGTWVSDPSRLLAFTHLRVVRKGNRLRASLCRWSATESRELRSEETTAPRAHRLQRAL